jgi:hypothetical protein
MTEGLKHSPQKHDIYDGAIQEQVNRLQPPWIARNSSKFNQRPGHIRSEKGKDSASRQHNPEKAKLSNLSRHSGMPQ